MPLPTALHLLTVPVPHSLCRKVGIARQLVLPVTALRVICCTFLGAWAGTAGTAGTPKGRS